MTTGGNLNDDTIDFISNQLIELYPTESIADIRLCFERGAMGRYGQIQRMDGLVIGEWMSQYLEEKYTELETLIQKRKTNDIGKEPVSELEDIYKSMLSENTKWKSVQEFNRREHHKKFGAIDMEQIEALRQAEHDGKHLHKMVQGPLTESHYHRFICDGHTIYADNEDEAKAIFKAALGSDPKKCEPADQKQL